MQPFDRIVYVSTLNGSLIELGKLIRQFQGDGRAYHEGGELTGLIVYGDGHILHCFECRQDNTDKLKQDTFNYPLHHHCQFIYEANGINPLFNSWNMVYSLNEPRIQAFMRRHGWKKFNPYLLRGKLLDEFMQVIFSYGNANPGLEDGQSADPAQPGPAMHRPINHPGQFDGKFSAYYLLTALGFMLVIGLILYGLKHVQLLPSLH